VQEGVAAQYVGVGLGAALGIDSAGHIVELTEDVEAFKHESEAAFQRRAQQAGVPDEVVGVYGAALVASAREHREVGGELEVPRKLERGGRSIAEIEGIYAGEVGSVAVSAQPSELALEDDGRRTAYFIVQPQVLAEARGVDGTPCGGVVAARYGLANQANAVAVFGASVGG